ncbi:menaquinone biosynthetic enzyme MqnA/MqnD family protein [Pectinatus brassicae]|uniref:Chorismate dehydratase n=1 Tax=Pectinatus brassicae TaxID=862415 RepID=A0A840UQK4_9FIRM|nr:menaquinone biosynthesis protein [Pectinatus brassicae]MBB5335283.1 chorismate dehydratase [Pectinatus brassicae]
MHPRVGHINFLNCLPLTYSLLKCGYHKDMSLVMAVPSDLNKAMANEELDISPMSSFAFAQISDKAMLMPNIGIVSDGEVQSIILVSRKPINELNQQKIILTAQSATSHCLLKIILQKAYNLVPHYEIKKIDPRHLFEENDDYAAALLIGDDALYVNHNHQAGLYYYDIGEQWKKMTGLPMVYAVWAVNRNFYREHKAEVAAIYKRLRGGFDNGIKNKSLMLDMVKEKTVFSRNQLMDYFEVIKYDVDEVRLNALQLFYKLAVECNLLEKMPSIEIVEI